MTSGDYLAPGDSDGNRNASYQRMKDLITL